MLCALQAVVLLAALPVLRRMLRHQSKYFADFVEMVVGRLLACAKSDDKEVRVWDDACGVVVCRNSS